MLIIPVLFNLRLGNSVTSRCQPRRGSLTCRCQGNPGRGSCLRQYWSVSHWRLPRLPSTVLSAWRGKVMVLLGKTLQSHWDLRASKETKKINSTLQCCSCAAFATVSLGDIIHTSAIFSAPPPPKKKKNFIESLVYTPCQYSALFFEILSDLNQAVPNHLADESQTRSPDTPPDHLLSLLDDL